LDVGLALKETVIECDSTGVVVPKPKKKETDDESDSSKDRSTMDGDSFFLSYMALMRERRHSYRF
jgi:hypothetical protein